MTLVLEYFLIFLARVVDVSLATFRMLLVVKGKKYPAAGIGFLEASIYIAALTRVLRNMDDPFKILAYGLGFATGTVLGSLLEEKVALGLATVEVVPQQGREAELETRLREAGFGVTVLAGRGLRGERPVLMLSCDRKSVPAVDEIIRDVAPDSFVTILETREIRGGVVPYRKAK